MHKILYIKDNNPLADICCCNNKLVKDFSKRAEKSVSFPFERPGKVLLFLLKKYFTFQCFIFCRTTEIKQDLCLSYNKNQTSKSFYSESHFLNPCPYKMYFHNKQYSLVLCKCSPTAESNDALMVQKQINWGVIIQFLEKVSFQFEWSLKIQEH